MVARLQGHGRSRRPASRSRRTRRSSSGARSARCSARWMNPRAITYRRLHDIPAEWGTAVNVQAMVFGNMGDDCATGVCFTRDPSTGENMFYGEYLVNAQGEDVVAGIRTPQPLSKPRAKPGETPLEAAMPARLRRADGGARDARAALPRHAGHRVHRPAEQAVHAADAQRQAHRRGQPAHRGGHGARGPDRPGRGGAAGQSRPRSTSCCIRRSIPKAPRTLLAQGPAGQPGRRVAARWCSAPTRRRAAPPKGEAVILVRDRDQPRGHPRHARRPRHPDHARRHDQPRRGGGARHGPALRRRRRRHHASTTTRRRCRPAARRCAPARPSRSTAPPARCSSARVAMIEPAMSGDFGTLMEWADKARTHGACAPTPKRRWTPRRRASSAPRASACAAPSTCSSTPSASARCGR